MNFIRNQFSKMKKIIRRNDIPLMYCDNNVIKNELNLQYCNYPVPNVGDMLSPIVYEYMLSLHGIDSHKDMKKTKHLYAIGSIIDFGLHDATVWGSGVLNEGVFFAITKGKRIGRKLDIRAVRGPLTRRMLLNAGYKCPDILGDPAILMPYIYQPKNVEKTREYSLIVHLNGADSEELIKYQNVISIKTDDYKKVIDDIVASKIIISSSLHGIILAESYGIPAVLVLNDVKDQVYKFYDWFLSTGRPNFAVASSISQALTMKPSVLPELEKMRHDLMKAFPYDLFK